MSLDSDEAAAGSDVVGDGRDESWTSVSWGDGSEGEAARMRQEANEADNAAEERVSGVGMGVGGTEDAEGADKGRRQGQGLEAVGEEIPFWGLSGDVEGGGEKMIMPASDGAEEEEEDGGGAGDSLELPPWALRGDDGRDAMDAGRPPQSPSAQGQSDDESKVVGVLGEGLSEVGEAYADTGVMWSMDGDGEMPPEAVVPEEEANFNNFMQFAYDASAMSQDLWGDSAATEMLLLTFHPNSTFRLACSL